MSCQCPIVLIRTLVIAACPNVIRSRVKRDPFGGLASQPFSNTTVESGPIHTDRTEVGE